MKKPHGFTMIELMVVISITAVLIVLAIPSFKLLIQSINISTNVNTFIADIRFARSEAIKRGGTVFMCRSDLPEADNPSCSNSANAGTNGWATGWFIFYDTNGNGLKDSNDLVLRAHSPILTVDTIVEGASEKSTMLRFTGTGRLYNLPDDSSPLQLTFGGSAYATATKRVVCVNLGGYARVAASGVTSCSAGTNN